MRGGLAGWVTGIAAAAGMTVPAQTPVFKAETDLVTFGVTVLDRRGDLVTDLTADDFDVVEEGEKQSIRVFARGDTAAAAPETHVGLLYDTSGSMGDDIQLARSAAIKFLNTLTEAADMTLVDFDTEVRVAKYGQADFPRMVERIRRRKPDGMTALYDALGVYLDGASEDDGRTILVLYTDGGDTRSALAYSDVVDLLRASDVTVYAVGFLEHQPSTVKAEQRMRLTQMAEMTGGHAIFPLTMKEVETAYTKIAAQIRGQYSLGYVSTRASADGKWRRVDVKVRRAGMKVRTRRGYFAAYRQ